MYEYCVIGVNDTSYLSICCNNLVHVCFTMCVVWVILKYTHIILLSERVQSDCRQYPIVEICSPFVCFIVGENATAFSYWYLWFTISCYVLLLIYNFFLFIFVEEVPYLSISSLSIAYMPYLPLVSFTISVVVLPSRWCQKMFVSLFYTVVNIQILSDWQKWQFILIWVVGVSCHISYGFRKHLFIICCAGYYPFASIQHIFFSIITFFYSVIISC